MFCKLLIVRLSNALLFTVLLIGVLVVPSVVGASETDPELEDVLGGFSDDSAPVDGRTSEVGADEPAPMEGWLEIDGDITLGATWNYSTPAPDAGEPDYSGLSHLRGGIRLKLTAELWQDWKAVAGGRGYYDAAYAINGRQPYPESVLDEMEDEVEVGEAYVQGRLSEQMDLTAGRQVVVWGRADTFRVTDVINPLDMREPGMVDIEDIRLPVTAARMDLYSGQWSVTAVVVHERRFDIMPPLGGDYNPLPPVSAGVPPQPPEVEPDSDEFALAVNGVMTGWDISFYAADFHEDRMYLELVSWSPELRHSKVTMLGAAASRATGDWLIFGEAARFDGLEFYAAADPLAMTKFLAGVEYSGISDTSVRVEGFGQRIEGFEPDMEEMPDYARQEEFNWSFRITRNVLYDTLHLMLLAQNFGATGQRGSLQRIQAGYDWSDSISVTAAVVNYESGSGAIWGAMGDRDRVSLEVKYSF